MADARLVRGTSAAWLRRERASQLPSMDKNELAPSAALALYGSKLSQAEVRQRIFQTLERRVLSGHNKELRGYFEVVVENMASPFLGSGEDDALTTTSDEDLEQTCLLFCHFDADGDGLLCHEEFAALVDLTAAQTGQSFAAEYVDRVFRQCDVDGNGYVDLNELLLYVGSKRWPG